MPQDLSNFLWASASLRCDVPLPLDVLAARAADLRWQHFKPQVWGKSGKCTNKQLLIVGYGGISSHPKTPGMIEIEVEKSCL